MTQNDQDYLIFQQSLQKIAQNDAFNNCSVKTDKKTKRKGVFKYSVVINILCDVIADVLDLTHLHHENASVNKWR